MQERIRYLESQVEEEREARRRADTLLARLMDRLPDEAPPETLGSPPEGRGGARESAQPRPDSPGPQEGVQRPWWRRMFGL